VKRKKHLDDLAIDGNIVKLILSRFGAKISSGYMRLGGGKPEHGNEVSVSKKKPWKLSARLLSVVNGASFCSSNI
jgi:hypothetical protein